ncbi:MAG: MalY/PatB family protein [Halanaerobiales bacterium]
MANFDQEIDRRGTNSIKWKSVGKDILPMWVADMEFQSPSPVIDAFKKRADHGIFGYTTESNEYYQAIVNWMKKRHNWDIKKSWICNSSGIVSGISMLINTITNPGEKIILQTPVYFSFFPMIKNNGRRIVENPLKFDGEKYTMDFEDLENKIDSKVKMLILCNPHNPVGRVWSKEDLKKLGEICLKNEVIIVSDEIHSDLVYEGNKHIPYTTLGSRFKNNSVVCTSPSKTFNFPGLEPGNLIIPDKKIRRSFLHTLKRNGITRPNIFAIEAVKAAYNQGAQWLEELLIYLRENYLFLKEYIEANIPRIKVIEPEGTYLVWLDFRSLKIEGEELEKLLKRKAKLALTPGYTFGKGGRGFQRINIACPRSLLEEALKRLEKGIKSII